MAGFKLLDHWGQKLKLHFMCKLHGYVFMKASKQAERNNLTMLPLTAQYLNKLRDDVTWKSLENQIKAGHFM